METVPLVTSSVCVPATSAGWENVNCVWVTPAPGMLVSAGSVSGVHVNDRVVAVSVGVVPVIVASEASSI